MNPSQDRLLLLQRQALNRYAAEACIDTHCHCLPGVDDGPETMEDAVAICHALVGQGITTVVATPHQLGRFDGCVEAPRIRRSVRQLNTELQRRAVPLTVLPGAEIRVDERIADLLRQDVLMTLADGGQYVLVELPFDLFIDIGPLLDELDGLGLRAVIAHPERNRELMMRPHRVMAWAEYRPLLQVTAPSLLGRFGREVQDAACAFLDMPLEALAATDTHDTLDRGPCLLEAFERIAQYMGPVIARRFFIDTPLSLIPNLSIVKAEPLNGERIDSDGFTAME